MTEHKDYAGYSKRFESVVPKDFDNINQGLKNLYIILSTEDVELDFYKQKIFMILYMINFLHEE